MITVDGAEVSNMITDAEGKVSLSFAEGGTYIVSGIIDTREKDVIPALAEAGFTVTERFTHGGWVALKCTR